jgi:hypothetical protein
MATPALFTDRRQFHFHFRFHRHCQYQLERQLEPRRGAQQPAMRKVNAAIKNIGNRSARSAIRVDSRRRRAAGSILAR